MKNFLILFSVLLLGLTSCTTTVNTVAMRPEPVVVERTNPPFTGAVWIDSEYRWDGKTYVIVPAHWSKPEKSGVWVNGHWKQTDKGYTWLAGYWK